ncbi:hypothetical protein VPH35_127774 [Triticum aestivum]|uniref:Uncharacterized protein n=1 Tax=Triticum aestivum TaxID=4565 RepID=A0A3B6SD07_WHEAT
MSDWAHASPPRLHIHSSDPALVDDDLAEHMIATRELSAKQWLLTMFDSLPHATLIRLVVTLWVIWTMRRKEIHEENYQTPLVTHQFIDRYIAELESIKRSSGVLDHAPPCVNWARLGMDSSSEWGGKDQC